MKTTYNNQAGFVSLFTVIFFMLLVTVITVGFLRIMAIEQRQATDNDLSANARAAAEAGVEEGKRALLAYYDPTTPGATRTELASAFSNTACNALTGSPAATYLGLDTAGNAIGNAQVNQKYTCLNVNLRSPDYIGSSQAGQSEIFPLRGVGAYNQVRVSWHLLSETPGTEGDGRPTALAPGLLLPPHSGVNSWSSLGYPAYLRVQLLGYPTTGPSFQRAQLNDRSRSIFMVPIAGGSGSVSFDSDPVPHGFDSVKGSPTGAASCSTTFTSYGSYLCSATISLPSGAGYASTDNAYFLRVTPLYGQTHFRVQLQNSGAPVDMNEVQPLIDATGQAADVYRRLQVRVRLNPQSNLPEYAAESADTICKNMEVADASYFRPNDCP